MSAITGEDVIGTPGQNLNNDELRLIVHLADGTGKNQIIKDLNSNPAHLRQLESNLKAKLGAKTKTHIVGRGFILGILIPRALCLMIIGGTLSATLDAFNPNNNLRVQTNQSRTRVNTGTRVVQSARTSAGRGSA